MNPRFFYFCAGVFGLFASAASATPSHCLTAFGKCKYPADFQQFEYVNPNAPKGGEVKLAENGTFDSLNYFLMNGVKAPGLPMLYDTLMTASQDEPQTYYGLLAESVDMPQDRSSATFKLRPIARWHDGEPITAQDVVNSFTLLTTQGDPTFKILYSAIEKVEALDAHTVRFIFNDKRNRQTPLQVAEMPILPKHYYDKTPFEKTTLTPPLGSGAYKIESVDPGRAITYQRVADYWAKDLPVMRGQNNIDRLRYDLYRDENVALEAFKSGAVDFRQEYIARNWANAYDFPALREGKVTKIALKDERPQGMQAFLFNTRKAAYSDRRVREAIGLTMDFEWLNRTMFFGAYTRNESFFQNTPFRATGTPKGAELALLQPFAKQLPPALFTTEFHVPRTQGDGNARANLLKAQQLLEEAGYIIRDGKRVNATTLAPLTLEFLLRQPTMERVAAPMRKNLERLGISSTIRMVDDAQYQKRVDEGDFDLISVWLNRGVFLPGEEQMAMWHSSQATIKGSANQSGLQSAVVDALLAKLQAAKTEAELLPAAQALDRVLLREHVVIPHWHSATFRIAYWNKFGIPAKQPPYNIGFQSWWVK